MHRRTPARSGAAGPPRGRAALTTAALAVAALAGGTALAAPASASGPAARAAALYPSDALTVPDKAQKTGRRVALPAPAGCAGGTTPAPVCGLVTRLDELDGFDLDPRLAVTFDRDVDVAAAAAAMTVRGGGATQGVDRVVWDAQTHTLYAHPVHQLDPSTTYRTTVAAGPGRARATATFTTLSAPDGLLDLRAELYTGRAYREAGIAPDAQGLTVDAVVPTDGLQLTYDADTGSGRLVPTPVPVAAHGRVVFGSYLAPQWIRADRTIAQLPTGAHGPSPVGSARLPFVAVLPAGPAPAGGFPTAVFGHGFTRTDGDVLLAAVANAQAGVATIGTDVVGHGYGPASTWTLTSGGTTRTLPAYARGVDLDGNGTIDSTEGSSTLPGGEAAAVGSRDGLRQTVADQMTLVRAIGRGLALDGAPALRTTGVSYFGQSFGGIYGTMLAGSEPLVARSVLDVAGGPITEIVRLSPVFRPLLTQQLQLAGLLNSTDPATGYFVESMPLRNDPPVLHPAPGALAIQDYLAGVTWLDRPGSPETFAPRIRKADTLLQVAYGDQTVPNPTAYTLLEAGRLFGQAALYRNDRTPTASKNPHGFLLDFATFPAAAVQAQTQEAVFLTTGVRVDPDGPGGVWQLRPDRDLLATTNYPPPAAG